MKTVFIAVFLIFFVSCSKKVITSNYPDKPKGHVLMVLKPDPVKKEPLEDLKPPVLEKVEKIVTIFFEYNSSVIPEYEKGKLYKISGNPSLKGGASPEGSDEYNYELGLKRAHSVREELERRGMHVLNCISVGENEQVSNDYELNRRCVITY